MGISCYYVNGRREKRVWLTGGSGFDIEMWATLIQDVQGNEIGVRKIERVNGISKLIPRLTFFFFTIELEMGFGGEASFPKLEFV